MISQPAQTPIMNGAALTARIIKDQLIDIDQASSGLLGLDNSLQVISIETFDCNQIPFAIGSAISDAVMASATGIVIYSIAPEGTSSAFDSDEIERFTRLCESMNVVLLDVISFSSSVAQGWTSARQRGEI
ncbi:MAG: hypothetical protein M3Q19_15810 [Pseudomonadota bacterium]|nr:hypothetical protein [Pseudomonadota bacterium]